MVTKTCIWHYPIKTTTKIALNKMGPNRYYLWDISNGFGVPRQRSNDIKIVLCIAPLSAPKEIREK